MIISKLIKINNSSALHRLKYKNLNFIRCFSDEAGSHFDIVIAGGGMVGTTLACTLGKNKTLNNKKILLLEASVNKPWIKSDKYSNRVVSLNPGTHKLFEDNGAWAFIEQHRFHIVKRLEVSDALSETSITFGKSEHTDTISYMVENDLVLEAAKNEAQKCNNLKILYGAKVKNYVLPDYHSDVSNIELENGEKFTCDLLLGCDGYNSSVRKAMQVDYVSWNHNQMGVVATLKFSNKFDNEIAFQRFLPTGPVALLPLTDELSSLVWSTTPQEAKRLLGISEEEFVAEINKAVCGPWKQSSTVLQATSAFDTLLRALNCSRDHSRKRPPKIESVEPGSRAAFPYGFGHASQYIRKGAALVGDAAHRIHPLAGQGVNLGFGDVACLNKVLGEAVYSGSTLSDLNHLKDYESARQKHNVPTMLAVEGLHRLYNTDFAPVVLLRGLGLQATHALEPLKKIIMAQGAV
ncbi:unnamed protein product [Ceutorhynchus assimilis]|uniref:Ubiquinone biosynthesis monooxygenase COQ6, mitochondrial n=1 Tax=Ceutorhynchus assimilis TaxID=467358 RepID=A0A9N9MK76_9CUCU|nr:unnamed protein product [Ceutorhynchus assimilis]